MPVLPPSASVTSTVDVPLASLFFSQEATVVEDFQKDIAASNNVIDGITIPEYRPFYGGVLGWRGTILVPASSVPPFFFGLLSVFFYGLHVASIVRSTVS